MLRNPFTKAVWDIRRALFGWSIALGAITLMYTSLYPSMSTPAMAESMRSLPDSLKQTFGMTDLSTPRGYLGSYVFGLIAPVLVAIFMVILGSALIAGDEENGRLDLVLAHPVSRTRLLLSRLGALLLAVVAVCVVACLILLAISGPAKIGSIGAGHLAAVCLHLAVFGALIGTLTLAVGAAVGRRAVAVAVGTAVLVLGYFANNLAPRVHNLAWTQKLSPFYWYEHGAPLTNGVDLAGCGLMLGAGVVFTVVGLVCFTRRDISS